MTMYTVRRGDCLSKLASDHGFSDYRTIYDHPNNAGFRKKRPNPHVIKPGDQIFIPDRKPHAAACETGRVHRFRVKLPRAKIRVFVREAGAPFANREYVLAVGASTIRGKTDGEGLVEVRVPAGALEGTLTFEDAHLSFHLRLGNLDPLTEVSGIKGRLNNLGFPCGSGDELDPVTEEALRRFQEAHGIEVTGAIDQATRDALRDLHERGEES
jgi:N-acetylmuramoyl-L-alanine amidase